MITTVHNNQAELVHSIVKLNCPMGFFELDPCYGRGMIHGGLERPLFMFDIDPKMTFVEKADCRDLPIRSGSIESVMFDPPFLAGGGKTGRMHGHYSSFKTWRELFDFYFDSLVELERVLAKRGIIAFKCQDLMNGRTQYFSHCEIYEMALMLGLYAKDLFILESKRLMRPHNMRTQLHARKAHTYFWVFQKSQRKNGTWGLNEKSQHK